MLNKVFPDSLTSVEIQMVHEQINILYKEKTTPQADNYENSEANAEDRPICHLLIPIDLAEAYYEFKSVENQSYQLFS